MPFKCSIKLMIYVGKNGQCQNFIPKKHNEFWICSNCSNTVFIGRNFHDHRCWIICRNTKAQMEITFKLNWLKMCLMYIYIYRSMLYITVVCKWLRYSITTLVFIVILFAEHLLSFVFTCVNIKRFIELNRFYS